MAVVADIDNLDFVVEPHEDTPQDREAFRQAVENRRDRQMDAKLSEEARRLLTRRRKQAERANVQSEGPARRLSTD